MHRGSDSGFCAFLLYFAGTVIKKTKIKQTKYIKKVEIFW